MNKYIIKYETMLGNEYASTQFIEFDAEDELHAINILLNFYEQMEEKISCIESIDKL